MTDLKPHKIECRIEEGEPVWRIDCPYPDDEQDKPCAVHTNSDDPDAPHDFAPGCGADKWIDESGYSIEDMLHWSVTGDIGMNVDVKWDGDTWEVLPWKTGAEKYLDGRLEDPEYRAAYEAAAPTDNWTVNGGPSSPWQATWHPTRDEDML